MAVYLLITIMPLFFVTISPNKRSFLYIDEKRMTENQIFVFMLISFSFLIAFEDIWGVQATDFENYRLHIINAKETAWIEVWNVLVSKPITGEVGALIIEKIAASTIGGYREFRLIIVTFIMYANLSFFKSSCKNWIFASWMWIIWGNFRFINNTVYQMLCSAIVLCFGMKYIQRKKFINYLVICLIASMFHTSALLYVVYYFIFVREYNRSIKLMVTLLSPMIVLGTNGMMFITKKYLPRYSPYMQYGSWYSWKVMIIPILVTAVVIYCVHCLKLKQRYPIGIWSQVLWTWIFFWILTMINGIAIRFTYIPEVLSISIFSACINECKSGNRKVIHLGALFASILLTLYLR